MNELPRSEVIDDRTYVYSRRRYETNHRETLPTPNSPKFILSFKLIHMLFNDVVQSRSVDPRAALLMYEANHRFPRRPSNVADLVSCIHSPSFLPDDAILYWENVEPPDERVSYRGDTPFACHMLPSLVSCIAGGMTLRECPPRCVEMRLEVTIERRVVVSDRVYQSLVDDHSFLGNEETLDSLARPDPDAEETLENRHAPVTDQTVEIPDHSPIRVDETLEDTVLSSEALVICVDHESFEALELDLNRVAPGSDHVLGGSALQAVVAPESPDYSNGAVVTLGSNQARVSLIHTPTRVEENQMVEPDYYNIIPSDYDFNDEFVTEVYHLYPVLDEHLSFEIQFSSWFEEWDDDSDDIMTEVGPPATVAANPAAVRALEKSTVGESTEEGTTCCVVCSEDVEVGSEITWMPCSHGFHSDCILKWLEISHTCPVCRFELPTNDSS